MEYDAILTESGGENQQFLVSKKSSKEYKDDDLQGIITKAFENISLLHKLRETRAFSGFSRIFAKNNNK